MGDGAVWVAALTGGTAVLASWVTNRGNIAPPTPNSRNRRM